MKARLIWKPDYTFPDLGMVGSGFTPQGSTPILWPQRLPLPDGWEEVELGEETPNRLRDECRFVLRNKVRRPFDSHRVPMPWVDYVERLENLILDLQEQRR